MLAFGTSECQDSVCRSEPLDDKPSVRSRFVVLLVGQGHCLPPLSCTTIFGTPESLSSLPCHRVTAFAKPYNLWNTPRSRWAPYDRSTRCSAVFLLIRSRSVILVVRSKAIPTFSVIHQSLESLGSLSCHRVTAFANPVIFGTYLGVIELHCQTTGCLPVWPCIRYTILSAHLGV